jgi:hypothetical protein
LRAPMRASFPDKMDRATLATKECKGFVHYSNWQRLADRKLIRTTNGLPELAQVAPRERCRSRMNKIVKIHI